MSAVADRVRSLVTPILADLKLDLYDLEHVGGIVRVTVDRDGGVDLDALALATRLISRELDHNDPMPGRYTLEVTSPGLERALRTEDHFRRVIGWKVQARTLPHVAGDRRVQGLLTEVDAHGFVIRLDDASIGSAALAVERRVSFADIERARTVFEWGGQPKPGGAKNPKKRPTAAKAAASTMQTESKRAKAAGSRGPRPDAKPAPSAASVDAPGALAGSIDEITSKEGVAQP